MNAIKNYGPGLTVLAAAAVILIVGPAAVRQIGFARTSGQIVQASNRLKGNSLLEELNQATRDIALMVEPSVVHISAEAHRPSGRGGDVEILGSTGSGWIYDEGGHIVTNAHVVEFATRIQVQLHTGELRPAELVGLDLRSDIAVLQVRSGLLHAAARSSNPAQQGDMVFAFGSPFDFRFSMSSGIVSGLGRSAGIEDITYQNFIQVDAAINPGNSGGPLTDVRGEVIGMNTAIATGRGTVIGQGQSAGIGLAIPVTMVEAVVNQLIEKGEVERGYLGVRLADLDQRFAGSTARARGFTGQGVEITFIEPKSPAGRTELEVGDVVTAVDGAPVQATGQLMSLIAGHSPGEQIRLSLWRNEDAPSLDVNVTLERLLPEINAAGAANSLRALGLADLATSTQTLANQLDVPFRRGVMIREVPTGSAAAGEVPRGSVITAVMDQPVATLDEFYTRLSRVVLPLRQFGAGVKPYLTILTPDGREMQLELPVGGE